MHACTHSPILLCTSLSPSAYAQDHDVFAAEAQTLGWEMPRDKSRLLDQYTRSLINSRIPSSAQDPSRNAAACFPEQEGLVAAAGCGLQGVLVGWLRTSAAARPPAAETGHDSPFSSTERRDIEGRNDHFLWAVRQSLSLSKPLFRHKSI